MVVRVPFRIGLAGALVATLWGCSDPWEVVEPGDSGAFKGEKSFMFDAPSIGTAKIDGASEEDYIAEGNDLVENWNRGKETFMKRFPLALRSRLDEKGLGIGPGPRIEAVVEEITVGELYTVDDNPNYLRTKIKMRVRVVGQGKSSDEVLISASAHGFATKPVELRFGSVGDQLGNYAADFVASTTQ